MTALENNISFQIERLDPDLSRASEDIQRAAFDPTLAASISAERSRDDANLQNQESESASGDASVQQFLPTGTTLEVGVGGDYSTSHSSSDSRMKDGTWGVSITQALLQGRGTQVNLATLRQSRLDTEISLFELQGAAETLVSAVEEAYWDYVLAERSVDIYIKSLEVANQQIAEVSERIAVGMYAETELTAPKSELASRYEQLIQARGTLAKQRLLIIRQLSLNEGDAGWSVEFDLTDAPELPVVELGSVEEYVPVALENRPDINQARLQVDRGDLDVVQTRNGLLPKLDFFIGLGGTHYTNAFSNQSDTNGDDLSYSAGLNFEFPLGNRSARARHRQSLISLEQTEGSLLNMEQLAQVDIRSAYVDVKSAEEGIKASKATRELREETLRIEEAKLRVGKSTTFLVSQAQRDVVESQIAEVEAIVEYRKALLDLFRLQGILLQRWGIEI